MARLPVDYDDIPDNNFDLIPEGVYNVIIRKATEGETKSGKPKLTLEMEIDRGDCEGRYIFDNVILIESCLWKLAAIGHATGVKGEGNVYPHNDLVNKPLIVTVKHEDYNDNTYAKVKRYEEGALKDGFTDIDNAGYEGVPFPDDSEDPGDF